MIGINDLVSKRKQRWEELHDIEYDARLVRAIADKILESKELYEKIREKPWLLIECCFSLVDKKKRNVPFFFNEVQRDFVGKLEQYGRKKPFFVLKGRQQGFTTIITAIQLAFAIVRRNFSGFTLADRDDNTKTIFIDKAKVMYNALPERLKPHEKLNSVNELFFDKLNSSWRVASASANVGRSRTLSFIHYSEIAFFRCDLSDLQKSIQEAAIEDALCIYETTANGFNEAKELWDSESCVNLFYEWWQTDEYSCTEYEYLDATDEWLSKRLAVLEEKGLSREQLAWYAKKYKSYIDKTAIRQEYPCTPEEAFVSSGDCIFDKDAISNYLSTFNVKSKLGYFEYKEVVKEIKNETGILGYTTEIKDISFKEDKNGYISIVEGPYVEKKGGAKMVKPYVIGADTAGTGLDYFTAKVLDNTTGRCVATLHKQRIDEDLFAKQIYCLGKYYNDALVGVETNYSRHPVRVLRELGYSNLYVAKKIGTAMDTPENYYGFVTSSITRPIIISNLVSVMREDIRLETDRQTLKEMTTFIKRADGRRAAAADGTHDDLVMASAIAHFIGIDYEHQIKTIDEGFDVLAQFYGDTDTGNSYVEW